PRRSREPGAAARRGVAVDAAHRDAAPRRRLDRRDPRTRRPGARRAGARRVPPRRGVGMTTTPIQRAARIIATAIVHGTSSDPALEAAHALAAARLLPAPADPFAAPGRHRPAPSPAAIATLADCRRAKRIADDARDVIEGMPGDPAVDAAAGEVMFV